MVERVIKQKAAIVITQLDSEVKLTARQQLGPSDWELAENVLKVLKPSLVVTKKTKGDHVRCHTFTEETPL